MEAWRALEHAGQVPDGRTRDRAGIYVGVGTSDHARRYPPGDPDVYAGHQSAALPARLAYLLNWRGPALAVDTACLSSFTALASLPDLYIAMVKAIIFGWLAAIIGAYKGLNAGGGPSGVGRAVNESVIIAFMALFFLNAVITAIYFQISPPAGL